MNKVKVMGVNFKLNGEIVEKGTKLEFKAETFEGKEFYLDSLKGKKVISLFPQIDTKICNIQTIQTITLAKKYANIHFVSISNDDISKLSNWCSKNNQLKNFYLLSDLKYGEFASKTNTLIVKLNKLTRGFMLLDENNVIEFIELNHEISKNPNFEKLLSWLN